jgi:hypothetical protein
LIAVIPVIATLALSTARREGKVTVTDLVKKGALMECVVEVHANDAFGLAIQQRKNSSFDPLVQDLAFTLQRMNDRTSLRVFTAPATFH